MYQCTCLTCYYLGLTEAKRHRCSGSVYYIPVYYVIIQLTSEIFIFCASSLFPDVQAATKIHGKHSVSAFLLTLTHSGGGRQRDKAVKPHLDSCTSSCLGLVQKATQSLPCPDPPPSLAGWRITTWSPDTSGILNWEVDPAQLDTNLGGTPPLAAQPTIHGKLCVAFCTRPKQEEVQLSRCGLTALSLCLPPPEMVNPFTYKKR